MSSYQYLITLQMFVHMLPASNLLNLFDANICDRDTCEFLAV